MEGNRIAIVHFIKLKRVHTILLIIKELRFGIGIYLQVEHFFHDCVLVLKSEPDLIYCICAYLLLGTSPTIYVFFF